MSEILDVIEVKGFARRALQGTFRDSDLTDGEASFNHVLGSNALDTSQSHDSVHGDSFLEGTPQARDWQDSAGLTDDPESPREIVHENVLVLFPVALFFVFLLFGLVIAFSE